MSNIELLQGDCLEKLKDIPSESIDFVLTDPPYNISVKNNFKTMGRNGIDFGEWDKGFNQLSYLPLLASKVKKGGHIIIFNSINNFGAIIDELTKYHFDFKNTIIWAKNNPMPRNRDRRLINSTELAILLTKKGAKWTFNRTNEKYNRDIFTYPVVMGKQRIHPTQKPVKLLEDLITIFSNENDTVLDCFMGSGSTGVACKHLNRNFIGIELDKEYFNKAKERIEDESLENRVD